MLTKDFEWITYPFESFNPPQAEAIKYTEDDINLICALNTSVGKTSIALAFFGYDLANKSNNNVIYTSPLKAISQEQCDLFNEVDEFKDKKILVSTSDNYCELNDFLESDIIIATCESLDSKCRNYKSHLEWLEKCTTICIDEAHLIGDETRGPATEIGLSTFSNLNKKARILFLSATMSNLDEISEWLTVLNGKETKIVQSDWRPVKINTHWVGIEGKDKVTRESNMMKEVQYILEESKDKEKSLIFVHTRRAGRQLVSYLKREGINVEFYHAGLPLKDRKKIIEVYKNPKSTLNCLISTSSLAMGVNL